VGVFVAVHGAYQVYQFFVHTRFIPALGPLERVLATPMLHRVHHGRDAEFLDKNYGGFFIFWDKLFGSFAPYTREPDYGVAGGIKSWSPLWANLHPYAQLVRRARRASNLRGALEVWLRPPEWRAPWEARPAPARGYGQPVPRAIAIYSLSQLATAVAGTLMLLWPGAAAAGVVRFALVAFVVATLVAVAAFWDRRAWALRAEAARLGAVAGAAVGLVLAGGITMDVVAILFAGCLLSGTALSFTGATAETRALDQRQVAREIEDHELQRLLLR
jgi:Fatty acid hydroxylase